MEKVQIIFRTNPNTLSLNELDNVDMLRDLLKIGFRVVMCNPWYNEKGRPQGNEYILEAEKKPNAIKKEDFEK